LQSREERKKERETEIGLAPRARSHHGRPLRNPTKSWIGLAWNGGVAPAGAGREISSPLPPPRALLIIQQSPPQAQHSRGASQIWNRNRPPPPPPPARPARASISPSMAGGNSTGGNAARSRKRVEATVLKRSRDGSAFTRCEACNKDVPVVLIDMHSCSLDSKIRMTLEAQVVEKTVEVTKTERKRSSATAKGTKKDPKRKRSPTAFMLFMADFRKDFKAAHPDNKSVTVVSKEAGERWNSMTDEEKKPYMEKAAELKALAENGEGSGENNVAAAEKEEEPTADDKDGDQEVDQPVKKRRRRRHHKVVADEEDQEDDEDKNDLDDDV
ncbi:hypothetical protein BS78_07G001800, partial [Paspalum vaginatum]